jgi:hypothetical protein
MSYGYVGAPAEFNGTYPNGGDSGMLHQHPQKVRISPGPGLTGAFFP